jgi:hypothetical protein
MKIMFKPIMAVMTVGALALGLASESQAAVISGNINFAGTVQLDTASAGTATTVTAWEFFAGSALGPLVTAGDGSFTGLAGSNATFAAPWVFGTAEPMLWTVGGFTFNLTSSVITSQGFSGTTGLGFVVVNGLGTVTDGVNSAAGTFDFTSNDPGAGTPSSFSFSAGTTTVPDGGSTLALLGGVLFGSAALRRKLKSA